MALERELAAELDPRRVQTREGSGGKKLSYLTTHDVKRTANRIFGYDGWSYVVDDLISLGEEPFKNSRGREGIRVGYRATVTVTIGDVRRGDVGYGDAMEYNGSRITPHELASKEAVSDALKRCLSSWGDQFGLVLYGADPAPLEDAEVSESLRGVSRSPARVAKPAAQPTASAPAAPPADERSPRPPVPPDQGAGRAASKPYPLTRGSAAQAGDEHTLSTNDLKLPPEARKVITAAQRKKLFALARGYNMSDPTIRTIVEAVTGSRSTAEIQRKDFDVLLERIELEGRGAEA